MLLENAVSKTTANGLHPTAFKLLAAIATTIKAIAIKPDAASDE